jgi:hypothetical protein
MVDRVRERERDSDRGEEGFASVFVLTQHSLNCFASIGDVKLRPQVSFVMGSFQYTKHSDACPMRVPKTKDMVNITTV